MEFFEKNGIDGELVDLVSLFANLSLVAVTGVLAYFTYVLGKNTKTLSMIPIMPRFVQDLRIQHHNGTVFVQYRNAGNGVAMHLDATMRASNDQETSLRPEFQKDYVALNNIVNYEIYPSKDETFGVMLEYEDIKRNSYKQRFLFHKIKDEFFMHEVAPD